MSISSLQYSNPGANTVVLSWSSDVAGAIFYIYRDGVLFATTALTEITVYLEDGEYPVFEVFDDAGATPADGYPARLELCWLPSAGADYYRIDEYADSAWAERDRVSESGLSFYSWTSRPLEDDTTHRFRIVPVGTNGNEGTAQEYSHLMVRYPDPPDVDLTYDAETGLLTVSEAV